MSSVLTIAEAAEDLKITENQVWAYHHKGLLAVMYTRNVGASSSQRGPRHARIDLDEWRRFKAFLTIRRDAPGELADDKPGDEKPRRGRPVAGTPKPAGAEKWLKRYRQAAK
jgi:hypothetical protein